MRTKHAMTDLGKNSNYRWKVYGVWCNFLTWHFTFNCFQLFVFLYSLRASLNQRENNDRLGPGTVAVDTGYWIVSISIRILKFQNWNFQSDFKLSIRVTLIMYRLYTTNSKCHLAVTADSSSMDMLDN